MKKIFIVEDHPIMQEMLSEFIKREDGLELCGVATTGKDALETIPQTSPDLVLVDVSLPGMNGIELVERVRAGQPDLMTLIISGHDESVYAEQAYRAGARGYVTKDDPFFIISAIWAVLRGEYFYSKRVRQSLGL